MKGRSVINISVIDVSSFDFEHSWFLVMFDFECKLFLKDRSSYNMNNISSISILLIAQPTPVAHVQSHIKLSPDVNLYTPGNRV